MVFNACKRQRNDLLLQIGFNKFLKCCGHDRMVVGFATSCAISAYHHKHCEFEFRSWRGVLDTTFCAKVCQ
jgi:hypothetical protein